MRYQRLMTRSNLKRYLPTPQELLLVTAFWLVLGVWLGFERTAYARAMQSHVDVATIFWNALAEHVILAIIAPVALVAARVFPFERGKIGRRFAVHALLCCVYTALHVLLGKWLHVAIIPSVATHSFSFGFMVEIYNDVWMYALMVAGSSAWLMSRRYRDEELRASQMQTRWKDAELRALRTQMQPHFLFNTLHSISSLVHHDVLAADDMIADLSLMLRRSLDQSADSLVSLDDELEIVSAYLRIQQRRFGDRLTWDCKVPAEIRQAAIPSLLLQTLVENSVRHGLSNQALPGCIEIRAALRGNDISIEVADNGVGFPTPLVEGLGISNSRERLQHLFGEEAELTIADREPRGTSVTMKFPLRIMQKRKEPADGNQDPDCGRRAAGAKPRPVASR